jgi:tetratricopeptide (TPR) repeat protein
MKKDPPSEQLQPIINLYNQGQLQQALSESSQLLERFPNSVVLYNIAGACNAGLMQFDAAINNYKQALKIKPDYAHAYNNMGNTLTEKGDLEAAIENYKQALKIKPDYVQAYNNIGIALKDKGDLEAAIESYNQVLKIKPDFAEAYRNLSNIHRYKEHDEYFLKMQSLCQSSSVSDEQRCHLNFALSKASEDLNEVGQSFNYLKIGNELRKKILSYDIKKDIELFSQLKKSYPSIALQSVVESSDLKPIFILGMPRSGTTLVEQIVSSHSEVTGAGELSYVSKFGGPTARGAIKPNAKMILDFRQRYLEALKKRSDGRSIVTDKMPQNFLYVGLIFSAFPDAKVIHVNRDPAATCWSNYKHYFIDKELGYCYDLDDTMTYFGLYTDLMQFWLGHYGDRIYNINYDNLTMNQDDETRKLIEYLELEWENDCLSPQHNKRSVRTVSQQQVRQKVYQGSSQQWRKFEPYLNGAFDQLTELN